MVDDVAFFRSAERTLRAALYLPEGPGPFPAVVSVHGGAWTSGDRFHNAEMDAALCAAGIVVLGVDFRMPPEAGYPAAVQDVHYAIRFLKEHAREYGSAPELVGGVGSSSGAQTLLLCALQPGNPTFDALPLEGASMADAWLAYTVACWPIADPVARYRMAIAKGNAKLRASHDAYFGDESVMLAASPQRIVESGEAQALPPLLVVQGTADDNVTPDMAERFARAYEAAGGAVDLAFYDGQPHGFVKNGDPAAAADACAGIARFIHAHAPTEARP